MPQLKVSSIAWGRTLAISLVMLCLGYNAGEHQSSAMPQVFNAGNLGLRPGAPASQTSELIKPGLSVGVLQLGGTRKRVIGLLGKKPEDEEYSYGEPCPREEIHWLDLQMNSNGLFVYLNNGQIFQIESATRRYRTADGITEGSSPADVHRIYSEVETFVLTNSKAKVNGGRDLVYWVDHKRGIAFEFYYDRLTRKRRLSKVIVFEPGSRFQPGGCVLPPQQLRKLQPFATEG